MLTGHDEITDRVKALDAGVDDYLFKPFSIDELMARLRAMHRRAETFSGPVSGSDVNEILKVADLSMNTRTRDVMRGDRAIRLSVKEYDLLNFLMRGAGRVLERQEIMHCTVMGGPVGCSIFCNNLPERISQIALVECRNHFLCSENFFVEKIILANFKEILICTCAYFW